MWLLAFSAAIAGLVALSLWRAVRQSGLYDSLQEASAMADDGLPSLAVIVPVRNEAHNIGDCLAALLAQDYPAGKLRIVIVDDNSTDGSAAIVRRAAIEDRRICALAAGELPKSWFGKPHACWQGALAAHAEWLCFIDADTVAEPGLLRSGVACALQRRLGLVSLGPFQQLTFFWDRLLIPIGLLAIAVTQDLARIGAPDVDDAVVNGQVLLVNGGSYFAVGGHAAVRSEVCEDAALARRVKAAGQRIALIGAERLVRVRMYRTLGELWEGLSKNIVQTYGGSARAVAIAVAAAVVGWSSLLLPAAAIVAAARVPSATAIAAASLSVLSAAAVFATTVALARQFRIPWWYGLMFPLGALVGLAIAVSGAHGRARRTVSWKGRVYTGGPA
jgi:chlorobactene glucosyltransferase